MKQLITSIIFQCYLRYVACNAAKHVDIYSMRCPPDKKNDIDSVLREHTAHKTPDILTNSGPGVSEGNMSNQIDIK